MQSEFTLGISFKIVFDYNFVLRVSLPPFLCSERRGGTLGTGLFALFQDIPRKLC